MKNNNDPTHITERISVRSLLIRNPKKKFIVFVIIGFLWMLTVRNITEPYHETIGKLIHTRNALLEIIIALFFIFLYLLIVYVYFHFTSRIRSIGVYSDGIVFEGTNKIFLPETSVSEIHIVKNKTGHNILRMLFYTRHSEIFSLNFINPEIIRVMNTCFNLNERTPTVKTGTKKDEVRLIFKLS
ncbi:hypothetical protein [Chryseobacterium sp. c4a]|uniref:hypothetical protein n=1 Tax=Chryseobacterium sp. c4a TaxID=1573582 RepID=UPI001359D3ED|nr:hypothetical protein [Chryseobacterium sp. c4a]